MSAAAPWETDDGLGLDRFGRPTAVQRAGQRGQRGWMLEEKPEGVGDEPR
jgi:hypothetical protein